MAIKKGKSTKKKEVVTQEEQLPENKKAVIYIGPSIKNVVNTNAVFITLPQVLTDFMVECPEISQLLVEVGAEFRQAKNELEIKGSHKRYYYEKVLKYIQTKGV